MIKIKHLIFLATLSTFMLGCLDKFEKDTKYDRPVWLEGKLYTHALN